MMSGKSIESQTPSKSMFNHLGGNLKPEVNRVLTSYNMGCPSKEPKFTVQTLSAETLIGH